MFDLSYRYQDKDTPVHRLNPFAKLAWVCSISILAVLFDHPFYLTLLFLATMPVIIMARVWEEWKSLMKYAMYMGLFIVVVNGLIMYHGTHVLVEFNFAIPTLGNPRITLEAIVFGLGMAVRLATIVSACTVLNFTIHPDDLLLLMVKLKLPYKSVLAISLSTRFIPALADDLERITAVQKSRGLEIDKGTLKQKIKNRGAVLLPLLANSLDRTVQIAEAMESHAFGAGKKRTYYREIVTTPLGIVTIVAGLLPLFYGACLRITGFGNYRYYPSLQSIAPSVTEWLLLLNLAVFLLAIIPLGWMRKRWELD